MTALMAEMAAPWTLAAGLLLLLILLVLFILFCRPWRLCSSPPCDRLAASSLLKADDLEQPLFSGNVDHVSGQSNDLARNFIEQSRVQVDGKTNKPRVHVLVSEKKVQSADSYSLQGDNFVLDVTTDVSEDFQIGQTLKHSSVSSWPAEDLKHIRKDSNNGVKIIDNNGKSLVSDFKNITFPRSSLTLEVIAGPSRGLSCSRQSTDSYMLPLTIGRVSPSDLLLKDSEVSGKHAFVSWNMNTLKWELIDMGSLNGTFVNSQAVHNLNSGSRHWSDPFEIADGDIVTLGTSSKVYVKVSQHFEDRIPSGVGMVSDPMSARRGGKRLPMEDVCFCQWPLPGVEQFGLFGIFDGHGGVGAARAASKLLPDQIVDILSNPERRARVLFHCDASEVLEDAFTRTEAAMTHQYEGCTATVLLIWFDHNNEFFAQCANVGDSACLVNINGKLIVMTEDHRVTSPSEQARLARIGRPLKDGEARICGLNICRMLGDKFLKEQDDRFSSEPYVSQVVSIQNACSAFALMASDGLWDVISMRRAVQLVLELKRKCDADDDNSAEMMTAKYVLNEARTLRTKDNTSVIFLDFVSLSANLVSSKHK